MYLKYIMIVLCCAMGNVNAFGPTKFAKKKAASTSSLPECTVPERMVVQNECSSEASSSNSDTSGEMPSRVSSDNRERAVIVAATTIASTSQLFFEYPGGNSPVYYSNEAFKLIAGYATSPTRSTFPHCPCGR